MIEGVSNYGYNKQNGTFSGAVQVFQVPHDGAEGDLNTKFSRLMDKLESIEDKMTTLRDSKNRG